MNTVLPPKSYGISRWLPCAADQVFMRNGANCRVPAGQGNAAPAVSTDPTPIAPAPPNQDPQAT